MICALSMRWRAFRCSLPTDRGCSPPTDRCIEDALVSNRVSFVQQYVMEPLQTRICFCIFEFVCIADLLQP
jgi:hypothetical protein